MSAGFKSVLAMMMGWHGDPWPFDVTQQAADDVLRRAPGSDDEVLRRSPGVADDALRRSAGAADEVLRRW